MNWYELLKISGYMLMLLIPLAVVSGVFYEKTSNEFVILVHKALPFVYIPVLYLHTLSAIILTLGRKGWKKYSLIIGTIWTLFWIALLIYYVI